MDLVLGGTRLKMGADFATMEGSRPTRSCMEAMTTTSYRPDGKAGANIGKALTDFNSLPTVAVRADELIEFDDANSWLWRTVAST
jgi:hypothetical protein